MKPKKSNGRDLRTIDVVLPETFTTGFRRDLQLAREIIRRRKSRVPVRLR